MIFEGSHLRPVSPKGAIALPSEWVPADGRFCAFIAPLARPVAIALHPAALAGMMRETLPVASRQTGLAMTLSMLEVADGLLLVPVGMREEAGLGAMAMLVGKGGHILIHRHGGHDMRGGAP